jgi:hypothetical protein
MNVTSDKGWPLAQPVSRHSLWTLRALRIGAVVCALVCPTGALAQAEPGDLGTLEPDKLVDRLIELNDAARQRYDSIEFYARVTLSRPGGADRQIEVAHVLLDKGRLRLEHVQESPIAAPGTTSWTKVLLRGPEYVAEWHAGRGSTIYQYKRGSDGQVPKSGRRWDSPHMGTQGVAWRLCGNGEEALSTYRKSRTDLVFRARASGERGVYIVSVDSGQIEVQYTIDGPKGFVITRIVVSTRGHTDMEHVHTLGEVGPGVWFPTRIVETLYKPDGRVDNSQTIDFTDVRVNPPVTDRDFTIESLPIPAGTRLVVTHADERIESFELSGNAPGTAPTAANADQAPAAADPAPAPKRITQLSKPGTPLSSAELRGRSPGWYFIIVAAVAGAGALALWLRSRRQKAR